jgi:hypothetical protein
MENQKEKRKTKGTAKGNEPQKIQEAASANANANRNAIENENRNEPESERQSCVDLNRTRDPYHSCNQSNPIQCPPTHTYLAQKIPDSLDIPFCSMKHLLDEMHTVYAPCIL